MQRVAEGAASRLRESGSVVSALHDGSEPHAGKTALARKVGGRWWEEISYAGFWGRVERFAAGLSALGVGKGVRVALVSKNRPEWPVADLAIQSLGAATVPVYPTLEVAQISYILAGSGAGVVIVEDEGLLEKIGAWGLTEAKHGSDSVMLETSAQRDGDEYVLNGEKRWIGNATFADIVIIWARDVEDGQVKGFVVEKGAPGFSTELITGKMGKRAVWQPDINLEDVRVPAENKLVGANSFKDTNKVLTATRGGVAWEAIGHAVASYEAALTYAKERVQFGKPIASFQIIQNKLANMLAEITTMQLLCFRLAQLQEQGKMTGPMASLAKMNNARKAKQVCADARDVMGGNGVLLEYHVARHLADMEIVYTYEGTDTIQSLIVGRDVTGISAFV